MGLLKNILGQKKYQSTKLLNEIQQKFLSFLNILDTNNQILKKIADLEEKSQGEYLFDINYISSSLETIYEYAKELIDKLIFIGGDEYLPLKDQFDKISKEINTIVLGNRSIIKDDFTVTIDNLNKEHANSVGSKVAQLGEIRSKLNLSVPDGFAITAWAYKYFVDSNNIQNQIDRCIHNVNIKNYKDLVSVSEEIQKLIEKSAIPPELDKSIRNSFLNLKTRSQAKGFAVRSSALIEDTVFSFAGQYATYLNIINDDDLLDKYKAVIASKFTPKAIYYFLSHSLSESELAMSVGCMEMINSKVSGVVYSTSPVNPDEQCLLINAIYGLGKYLVDGTVTPDVFKVDKKDNSIKERIIATKNIKLAINETGGIKQEEVPVFLQNLPCIDESTIKLLSEIALKIERHYGFPQDIEWALDEKNRLFILQTRPLQVIKQTHKPQLDFSNMKVLMKGGVTVCPGAGSGIVHHANKPEDLSLIPEDTILITRVPFPGIIMFINRINAIVTEQGGTASHMATIVREYRIPTLSGIKGAINIPEHVEVTVDATGRTIYEGKQVELINARHLSYESKDQLAIFELTKKVLSKISPLSLVDSTADSFKSQNCKTIHDITRFVHQKAMEEMFKSCSTMGCKEDIGLRLKTDIPMAINIIYVDRDMSTLQKNKWIDEQQIDSIPMTAFWNGVKKEGWPSTPHVNLNGLISVMATQVLRTQQNDFLERSFAILGKEYMLLGLHMGYHFSTVEAMCTDDISKNYIRIQYKDGGATIDRRIRRIKVLAEILSAIGFSNFTEGDFLDSSIHYQSCNSIKEILEHVGRLSIMSKQLDMALANDSIASWYKKDFLKKLNLTKEI